MNLISCTLWDKLLRLGHKMIARLGDKIGLLQPKAAAKLTATSCGIVIYDLKENLVCSARKDFTLMPTVILRLSIEPWRHIYTYA